MGCVDLQKNVDTTDSSCNTANTNIMAHETRDFHNSKYKDTIGILPEHKSAIKEIKGKKSMAGKLNEIIVFYFEEKKLTRFFNKKQ